MVRRSFWLLVSLGACAVAEPPSPGRDWAAIVAAGHAVPEGADPFHLMLELGELLGSPDPRQRDDFAYGIGVQWIVRQGLFDAQQLQELALRWRANLRRGLGEVGTDSVLLRSFSALSLASIAARDVAVPVFSVEQRRALLADALVHLREERDLRDHDATLGWIHAIAHTADLLKFLARNPASDGADLEAMLEGIAARLAAPVSGAFRMGEDERLARALAAIVLREQAPEAAFTAFLQTLRQSVAAARQEPFEPRVFAAEQNILHCLRALYSLLAATEGLPPHAQWVRDALRRWFAAAP